MLKQSLLVACTVLGFAACAHVPRPGDEGKVASSAELMRAANPVEPKACQQSASRIPRKDAGETAQPCRVYTGADIDRTGRTSIGEALRQLDPAIR